MRHVAWPTRAQTIVYTILVVVFSVLVSLYLGLFDFIFTTTLGRVVSSLPGAVPQQQVEVSDIISSSTLDLSTPTPTDAPASNNSFSIPTN